MVSSSEDPDDNWMVRRQQAGVLACRGEYSAARRKLWRLMQEASTSHQRASAACDLAAISAALGYPKAAKQGFCRALKLAPHHIAAKQNLLQMGQFGEAASVSAASARPRIAILSLLFNWPSTGGGTVHTKELADALQENGYEVRQIYAVQEQWGLGRVTEPLSVSSASLVFENDDWTAESIQARFRDAVDEFAPDVVIITDSWNTKPLMAEAVADYPYFLRLAALETICPLNNVRLLFERGGLVQCQRNQLAEPQECRACVQHHARSSGGLHQAERQLAGFFDSDYPERLRRAYQGAEGVLAVNPAIADLVRRFCRRVHVVPSGFDPWRFPEPEEHAPRDEANSRTRFLFAGLVDEPMKGFAVLMEACQQLWSQRQDFELIVTSDVRSEWDAPFVRWIGWQSQTDLPAAIRAADVLMFPTLAQEALGRTAVEAMGCDKPVIASRLGGLPWVVEEGVTGLLVNSGDPSDLVSKMTHLLDDPALRRQLGRAGREKFAREFPWPVILERHYRPIFQQVVAQRASVG